MTPISSLLRGSGILLVGQVGLLAAGFVQTIVLTRYLEPSEFGVWALVLAYVTLIHVFLSFRTSESLTVFWVESRIAGDREKCALLFSSALFAEVTMKAVASVLILASAFLVLDWSSVEGDYRATIVLCVLGRFFAFYDPIWTSIVRDRRKVAMLSTVPVVVRWMQTGLTFGLIFFIGSDLVWAAVSLFAAQGVSFLVKVATTFEAPSRIFGQGGYLLLDRRVCRSFTIVPEFWRMMRAGYFASSLSAIPKEADTIVVGLVASEEEAGFYRIAKSLVSLILTGVQTLSTLIIQDFSEMMIVTNKKRIATYIAKYAPMLVALMIPACIVGFLIAPSFIAYVYGDEYGSAAVPFRILLVGTGFAAAFFWTTPLLAAMRQFKEMLRLQVVNFGIYSLVLTAAIFYLGEWAPAVALSVAWITGHVGALLLVKRALWRSDFGISQ